jgi:hypothetical protein
MMPKSVCYRKAAKRIASQKIRLAKIVAEQRHAQDPGIRRRNLDIALLRNISRDSQMYLIQLAHAENDRWMQVKEKLDDQLERFEELVNSGRLTVPHLVVAPKKQMRSA